MRIDALNRTPTPPDAEKPGPTAPQTSSDKEVDTGSDQVEISQLTQSLATPVANRMEQLRLQIQSRNYDASAEAVAAAIIESHLKE
jgi:anti-sigma28 factor (negative regulator of flagellin synthesis)